MSDGFTIADQLAALENMTFADVQQFGLCVTEGFQVEALVTGNLSPGTADSIVQTIVSTLASGPVNRCVPTLPENVSAAFSVPSFFFFWVSHLSLVV